MNCLLWSILLSGSLFVATAEARPGLLGLERVLDVNALVGSGKDNKGDGVQENQVKGNQQYWHNIFNYEQKGGG